MATSMDINLPRSHVPRFPDRCVVCGCTSPQSHVRLMTDTVDSWKWLLWWWCKPIIVKAPSCSGCAWKLHALRSVSLGVTLATAGAVCWFLWPHLKDIVPRRIRTWVMLAIVFACLLPQTIFQMFFAMPFDVTAFTDSVDYEFTSEDYAFEFMKLNTDAACVKVNGEVVKPR